MILGLEQGMSRLIKACLHEDTGENSCQPRYIVLHRSKMGPYFKKLKLN